MFQEVNTFLYCLVFLVVLSIKNKQPVYYYQEFSVMASIASNSFVPSSHLPLASTIKVPMPLQFNYPMCFNKASDFTSATVSCINWFGVSTLSHVCFDMTDFYLLDNDLELMVGESPTEKSVSKGCTPTASRLHLNYYACGGAAAITRHWRTKYSLVNRCMPTSRNLSLRLCACGEAAVSQLVYWLLHCARQRWVAL